MTLNSNDNDDRYQVFATAILKLSTARTIEQVGDIVRVFARQLTGAEGATFILRENNLCYYANEDAVSPLWKGKKFPMETCISGWVMLNKMPAVIPDIYQDARIPIDAYRPTFVKSLAMVPIRKDNPLGAIGNYWSTNAVADQQTLKVLQALADITAVSIENINIYNELEKRVHERTIQLEQTNEQLTKLNNELQTITYALSHDLKAPLRSIGMNVEKLVRDLGPNADAKTKAHSERIMTRVNNTQNLIDELLTLFQTSNKELDLEQVDMKSLAQLIAHDYRETLPEHSTILIDDLPPVGGDRALLRHVWANLISNAIKYTSRRPHPQIRVGFQEKSDSIVYCVEDNGVGFDSKNFKDIFKPFTRFHSSEDYEGAGIGLSIVDRIVSRHGGKVWAKSEVEKGTTVFFDLPKSPG